MLPAQAQTDDYLLVTRDPAMYRYRISWVWDAVTRPSKLPNGISYSG